MESTHFRHPKALSSVLAMLRLLQPQALGFLNCVVPLVLVPNYYVVSTCPEDETEYTYNYYLLGVVVVMSSNSQKCTHIQIQLRVYSCM